MRLISPELQMIQRQDLKQTNAKKLVDCQGGVSRFGKQKKGD